MELFVNLSCVLLWPMEIDYFSSNDHIQFTSVVYILDTGLELQSGNYSVTLEMTYIFYIRKEK